jgi:hypothetical protein
VKGADSGASPDDRSQSQTQAQGRHNESGWGHDHQRRRAAIAPFVNAGNATCARCHQPIHAGESWHLDYNETRDGYLGVSHAYCSA